MRGMSAESIVFLGARLHRYSNLLACTAPRVLLPLIHTAGSSTASCAFSMPDASRPIKDAFRAVVVAALV